MAAAAKTGVAAAAWVREGRCGCGSCRHSHGPAACWPVVWRVAVAKGASVVAVAVVAVAKGASVVAPAVVAMVALAVAVAVAVAEEPSVAAKTEEASAAELCGASTPAAAQPVPLARLEPQPLGPAVALCAKQPVLPEPRRLPAQERPFGLDSAQTRHPGGLRAAKSGGGPMRRPRQWSRRGAPGSLSPSAPCLTPLPPTPSPEKLTGGPVGD